MSGPGSHSGQGVWRPSHNPWLIAVSVMAATFMEILDTSVANVALPHIAGNLSVTTEEATWVLTSYLISNAIILPITAWLSVYFGRKRLLTFCIGMFTAASVLCGMAPTLQVLIVARILQGIGGGALLPISQAVLLESFPIEKRGVAMATFGMGVVVAPILGPTLGGWITDNYSWRWIFYINLPVGIFAMFMAQAFVEDPPYIKSAAIEKVDWAGFGLLALWLGTLQVVLDKGEQEDWFSSPWICWFTLLSCAAFVAFIVREFRTSHPVVNLHILKNRNFGLGVVLITSLGAVLYGTTAALPIFLQISMGYPALQSGLALSPRGVGAFVTNALIGRLVGKVRLRYLMTVGFGLLAISTLWLANINLEISIWNIIIPAILNGVAMSFIFTPLTTATMAHLRQEQIGSATGIFNLMRNLGGSFGIALVSTWIIQRAQIHQGLMVGHLTPYDPEYTQRLGMLTHAFQTFSDPVTAEARAQTVIYHTLQAQAQLWAFVENFKVFGYLCFACLPLVWLFKKSKGAKTVGAGH